MDEIKDQAEYYQNMHILDDSIRAVVLMENMEDEIFWNVMLQRYRPGNYMFIGHDNNVDNSMTIPGGCTECLKYKDYLTQFFFVCIDTDMNQMLGNTLLCAHNYICQTYTYSWENHCCELIGLQEQFEIVCPNLVDTFDFRAFLTNYSNLVFTPMLLLLSCAKHGSTSFTIKDFSTCIPKQCTRTELTNNGEAIINKIRSNFAQKMPVLSMIEDLTSYSEKCSSINIDANNAYLHTRGHNIYDLLCYIGQLVCRGQRVNFKKDIMLHNMSSTTWEMRAIENDLTSF